MMRQLASIALCIALETHAAAQPVPDLPAALLAKMDQMFDPVASRGDGTRTFVCKPSVCCDGVRLQATFSVWRPEDAPGVKGSVAGNELLERWVAGERAAAGQTSFAAHEFTSGTGVRGPLLWFDRAPGVDLGPVEHVTLGALPRADGSMLVLRLVGSGACAARANSLPIRCLESFDVERVAAHGPRTIRSAQSGYAIDLPFDWNYAMVCYCGNSFMVSEEERVHSFFITADFGPISDGRAGMPLLHLDVMQEPQKKLVELAREDIETREGSIENFRFDDGQSGYAKRIAGGEYGVVVCFRMLGSRAAKLSFRYSRPEQVERIEAAVRTLRPFAGPPETVGPDGRAIHSFGFYSLTHLPAWEVSEAEYGYMGTIAGDCHVIGPSRADPKARMGTERVTLSISVQRRSDVEAREAQERRFVVAAPTPRDGTQTTTTDETLRTADGTPAHRHVTRTERAARAPGDPRMAGLDPRIAAIAGKGMKTIVGSYTIHAPDGVTDLTASALLMGKEADADLAELDRIVASIRFEKPGAAPKASSPTPDVVR